MSLIKDMAVVLRRLDYSETSQVIVVFMREHGQQRLIAKGIKRGTRSRVAVGVDLLERGRVVFSARPGQGDGLSVLTEWRQEDGFPALRSDLPRLYAAQYAAEVTSKLTEVGDPHPALFDALVSLLRDLSASDAIGTLVSYLKVLLREIGLGPEWRCCTNCSRSTADDAVVYFSSRQGGTVCRDCEPAMVEKRRVSRATLDNLSNAGVSLVNKEAEAAFDLLDYHFREVMSGPARLSGPLRAATGMKAM